MNKSLSIIYTFAPYVDTAGIVFAKRMQAEIKEPMTVISCKAYNGAPKDASLEKLVSPYLNKLIEIDAKFTYRDWSSFADFYNKAIGAYKLEISNGENFEKIYSRSMSVISHLVAFKIKCLNPEVRWIAEFSDPIIKDVTGEDRSTIVPDAWLSENLNIEDIEFFRQYNNLFSLSEILVYLFADEIKFTNELQKEFMLDYFSKDFLNRNKVKDIIESVNKKSIVSEHPVLSEEFYNYSYFDSEGISDDKINIAYFGNINAKRSFDAFFNSWLELDIESRKRFRFYVFSNIKKETILNSVPLELQDYTVIERGLPYLKFLNSLNSFDFLLTVDSEVKSIFGINPFLPSKLSDYLGSKAKVLAMVEKGSPTDLKSSKQICKYDIDSFNMIRLLEV